MKSGATPTWNETCKQKKRTIKQKAGVDHVAIRDHCLSTFARFFGRMPLVTGSAKLVDAKREWLW